MTTLRVRHRTHYRYARPVAFGVHRLMLRPRDGHDMRILNSTLTISPAAQLHWEFDVFGNSVAYAAFRQEASELTVESELLLRRFAFDNPAGLRSHDAMPYPVVHSNEELIDLAPLLRVHCPDDNEALQRWLREVLPDLPNDSLAVLRALATAVHNGLAYRRREEPGVQTPGETLAKGSGTCRDYAFLFMEAARHLGFAARFVTGYLYDPATDVGGGSGAAVTGGGATHAWADIFVPGAGWVEFDPTNLIVAGNNLVRVATTRTPSQALPVSGTYSHDGVPSPTMEVTVSLTESVDDSIQIVA